MNKKKKLQVISQQKDFEASLKKVQESLSPLLPLVSSSLKSSLSPSLSSPPPSPSLLEAKEKKIEEEKQGNREEEGEGEGDQEQEGEKEGQEGDGEDEERELTLEELQERKIFEVFFSHLSFIFLLTLLLSFVLLLVILLTNILLKYNSSLIKLKILKTPFKLTTILSIIN